MKHQYIGIAVMALLFAVAPLVVYPVFMMKAMCFALFACAFNLLIGFGGLLSFGHAMFLGTAGYAAAHSAKIWGFPPELAVVFGTACAFLLSIVSGLLAIRRLGIYFSMITLALAQMVFFFYLQMPLPAARTASRPCRAAGSSASSISPTSGRCTTPCSPCSSAGSCSSTA